MNKWYKTIMKLLCAAAFVLAVLPLTSVEAGNGETCTLIIHGYNLMEFSPWGVVPLMAPILVLLILFGKQSKSAKEAELLLLLVASVVCYVHSFQLSTEWLRSVGTSIVTRYLTIGVHPMSIIGVIMLGLTWDTEEENSDIVTEKD